MFRKLLWGYACIFVWKQFRCKMCFSKNSRDKPEEEQVGGGLACPEIRTSHGAVGNVALWERQTE